MMEHLPLISTAPPLRCAERLKNRGNAFCGATASWKRLGNHFVDDQFFCDEHRLETDEPIAGDRVFRRITVHCDVTFAGVTMRDLIARAEAMTRLRAAVEAAGGLLDAYGVDSCAVRWAPQGTPYGVPLPKVVPK